MPKRPGFFQHLWRLGWAPVGVLVLHFVLAALFGHRRELDPVFHFLGGAAGAYFLLRMLDGYPERLPRAWARNGSRTIVFAMIGVALLWELAEFGSDRVLGSHIQQGPLDTWSDVALGAAGAVAAVWVETVRARRR